MAGKQAKILSDENIDDLISYASATRYPERNVAISLLSAKAGLRAGEIAKLDWDMLLLPTGEIGPCIELRDHAAKKGSGRRIPVHPRLMQALIDLRSGSLADGSVIQSERGGRMHPVGIVNWFANAYRALDLQAVHRIRVAAHSSPGQRARSGKRAGRSAMCNFWPAIGQSSQRSGISTATRMRSAGSWR